MEIDEAFLKIIQRIQIDGRSLTQS